MKIVFFSSKSYEQKFFDEANEKFGFELVYFAHHLSRHTELKSLSADAVCVFVNDILDYDVLSALQQQGIRLVVLRCAGFNNVDLPAAEKLGVRVVRVPAYSPYAVAEHTVGLMLSLNRKIHRAHNRVREGNFSLEGLLGFDMHGRTAGVIGTGRIGSVVVRILSGMGCCVLVYDPQKNNECVQLGARYVSLPELYAQSDIISLHCPLDCDTRHLINAAALAQMKDGVMLINTSRGAVIDAAILVSGLKSGKIGYLGLDVYEQEGDLFFEDLSNEIIQDDVFERLVTFPNVLITGHQGYFTEDALRNIAQTSLANVYTLEQGQVCENELMATMLRGACR
ncbi:D-lactate dehydrogenase [hydrothermal vent metagenome]|uniref:D-lactate dehydrogenase n=1 Tax=hydrothermal vent metagenome TaxID=652676 RepID=A0A3B0ZVW6_9ZZZZ